MIQTSHRYLATVLVLSLGALGVALISQHLAGMRPCAWCVFQRLLLIVIAVLAIAGLTLSRRDSGTLSIRIPALLGLGVSIGGIMAAWYQYSVAAMQFSCERTFADRFMTESGLDGALPWLFGIYATCMDARVDLFGIEYALWALALFVILAGLSLAAVLFARPARHRAV